METITKSIDDRKPAFVSVKAHTLLPRLSELLADELGVRSVSYLDAASIAIERELERLEVEHEKKGKVKA